MKYDYVVNHNGVIYGIGEEVPDTSSPVSVIEEKAVMNEAKVEVTKNKGGRPRKAQ